MVEYTLNYDRITNRFTIFNYSSNNNKIKWQDTLTI
jgi:hypothetical protein